MTGRIFIYPSAKEPLRAFFAEMPKDKRYRVTIEEYRPRRSLQANAFYWSCVVTPLAEACGYTENEMHEELLGGKFGWEEREFMGHVRKVPRLRSRKLETPIFQDLIHHGQRIAAELGVRLPDQQEVA